MRKKYYFILALLILLGGAGVGLWLKPSPAMRIPVKFSFTRMPVLSAVIENQECLLELDLGSKHLLSLEFSVLDPILNKKSEDSITWRDLYGRVYESPSYRIPYVRIQNIILKDVVAHQENEDFKKNTLLSGSEESGHKKYAGTLGRPLLEKTNLLLDFKHGQMFACHRPRQLIKAGFNLEDMLCMPFDIGRTGIIIKVNTDFGELRLGLDTGATYTFVRSSYFQRIENAIEKRGLPAVVSQRFLIGTKDFGQQELFLYDIASELTEVEGILGMDFLEKHVVYIDYKARKLYID